MLWKLKIVVIDDEPFQVDIIKSSVLSTLKSKNIECEIDSFTRASQLLAVLEKTMHDVYFIDINLINYDGITLAKKIKEINQKALIVFISNQEERVYDSLDVQPIAFVRKNYFLKELEPAINKIIKILYEQSSDNYILIKSQGSLIKLDINSCIYIESQGKKQILHQNKTKVVVEIHSSMEILEKELSSKGFFRIHKGYLVNYRYISYIANLNITLTNGDILPISRDKNTEIKEKFIELTKENSIIF